MQDFYQAYKPETKNCHFDRPDRPCKAGASHGYTPQCGLKCEGISGSQPRIDYTESQWHDDTKNAAAEINGQSFVEKLILDNGASDYTKKVLPREPSLSRLPLAWDLLKDVIQSFESGAFSNELLQEDVSFLLILESEYTKYTQLVEGLLIPPEHFTAGYIPKHLDLFKTYFRSMGIKTADVRILYLAGG